MSNYNKIILVGRLTRDPEVKYTQSGAQMTKFGLAVGRRKKEETEPDFFNVTAWNKLAEICAQYLHKGSLVLIEGEVRTGKYTDREGVVRHSFDVWVGNMQMLGSKQEGEPHGGVVGKYNISNPKDLERYKKETGDPKADDLSISDIQIDEFDAEDMPF